MEVSANALYERFSLLRVPKKCSENTKLRWSDFFERFGEFIKAQPFYAAVHTAESPC